MKKELRGSKKIIDRGEYIVVYSFIFQLTQTVVFLLLEGWHWTATHPVEKLFDNLYGVAAVVGLAIMLFGTVDAVRLLINNAIDD